MKTRILIVEDDAALARVLRDNLSIEGFQVHWAADAHMGWPGRRSSRRISSSST